MIFDFLLLQASKTCSVFLHTDLEHIPSGQSVVNFPTAIHRRGDPFFLSPARQSPACGDEIDHAIASSF